MKQRYEAPETEIIFLEYKEDIITASSLMGTESDDGMDVGFEDLLN